MNPSSNFRQHYQNDPKFYKVVINKEDPPFDFKIHLFLDESRNEENLSVRVVVWTVPLRVTTGLMALMWVICLKPTLPRHATGKSGLYSRVLIY